MCVELITFVGLFGAPKHLWWIFVKSRRVFPSLRRLPCHWRWFLALFSAFPATSRMLMTKDMFLYRVWTSRVRELGGITSNTVQQERLLSGQISSCVPTLRHFWMAFSIFFIILPSTAQHRKEPVVELRNARLYPGISWKSWSSLSSLPKMFGTIHYHLILSFG